MVIMNIHPASYGEGTGSVLSPLGETSLSRMVGCSLFQVHFCCCDRTVRSSLGEGRVYLAQNFRSQTITEGKPRQELKQLVTLYPRARAERNERILACILHLTGFLQGYTIQGPKLGNGAASINNQGNAKRRAQRPTWSIPQLRFSTQVTLGCAR